MKTITDSKDLAPELRDWLEQRGITRVTSTLPDVNKQAPKRRKRKRP